MFRRLLHRILQGQYGRSALGLTSRMNTPLQRRCTHPVTFGPSLYHSSFDSSGLLSLVLSFTSEPTSSTTEFLTLLHLQNVGKYCGAAENSQSAAGTTKVVIGCNSTTLSCEASNSERNPTLSTSEIREACSAQASIASPFFAIWQEAAGNAMRKGE